MANSFSYQTISANNKREVVKLTGQIDANGEFGTTKIIGQNLSGALAVDSNNMVLVSACGMPRSSYRYSIARIIGDVFIPNGYLNLLWDGANSQTSIMVLSASGDYNMQDNLGNIQNTANGFNGNIICQIAGSGANNSYTVWLELHKDPRDFNQGQVQRPQDFGGKVTP
jgi:hypothetical protein